MTNSARDHKPGEAPDKPPRDANGVHIHRLANAAKTPDACPPGMVRDPATGECIAPPEAS